jgi:N-acetylglucosamine-6-phosphate deacetylase
MRAEDGTIAGSALRMDEGVRNYMAYTELPFAKAIVAATLAPAKLLGMDRELGRIAPGLRADLSFWDEEFTIIGTMVGGHTVFGEVCTPAAA